MRLLSLSFFLAASGLHVQPSFDSPLPVPEVCAQEVTPSTGRPVFFPFHSDVRFGLSARPAALPEQAPLAIWIYNSADTEAGVATCSDLERFFIEGFDVLDQSGKRVLANDEITPGHGPPRRLRSCLRNVLIKVPAHTCIHGDLDHPTHDFVKHLGDLYSLHAGRYQVVPRSGEGQQRRVADLLIDINP